MLKFDAQKWSFWQRVFLQSKVNGAFYQGEQLPGVRWEWPKDTYLQRRLRLGRADAYDLDDKGGFN
jgi:hypothetical protein